MRANDYTFMKLHCLCKWTLIALMFAQLACYAEIVDNFSESGWEKSKTTPGGFIVQKNKLFLDSKTGGKGWVNVSKTYDIDVDKTPLLVVRVPMLSGRGEVKLILKEPFKKIPVFAIAKSGVYTVNMKENFRWKGKNQIEVNLYAIGDGSKITYQYVKFTDKLSEDELAEIAAGNQPPENRPKFELVPLFNSCGYYYVTPAQQDIMIFFREKDGRWNKALAPVWISEEQMYRGSIVGLNENTSYEFKIVSGEKILATKFFKTWGSQVPVASTVVLDENNFKGYLKISDAGAPDGWIKYTAAAGFILKSNGDKPLIDLIDAKYILLDGLVLQGGGSSAVVINNCNNVRINNCDISGWGRVGIQRFDKDGKYYTKDGKTINCDGGIYLNKSKNTVVERCYIHDPRNRANSWRYSHPAGPEAMMINRPESTVIRFNDFIGSDEHRWNDAVEGAGNFYKDGGFNRDADIYG
ncbi:MAG: right-handed parallel beta-helix repeat-containing protein, partial [Victivallaceae bacterium]